MTPDPKGSLQSSRNTYVTQLNGHLVRAGWRVGSRYLDNYGRLVGHVIAVQHKLANQSRDAYTSAARKLIP